VCVCVSARARDSTSASACLKRYAQKAGKKGKSE
jgi:hypothetical protein